MTVGLVVTILADLSFVSFFFWQVTWESKESVCEMLLLLLLFVIKKKCPLSISSEARCRR